MEIPGRVQNGVFVFDSGTLLPEGAAVAIVFPSSQPTPTTGEPKHRIQLPLVHCHEAGSIELTNARIAELLDDEDLAP
jgi:hypothetical protein